MITLTESLTAYRADPPAGVAIKGGLVVIHEIWGLVAHIRDVADRFAAEGYIVVAPDILSRVGVVPEVGDRLQHLIFHSDEKTRTEAQPLLRDTLAPSRSPEFAAIAVGELRAAVDYLAALPAVAGRIAVTGFCFGGGYSFALAAADPRVRAAVPFYGQAPEGTEVASIACPVLAFYGTLDEGLMATLPAVTAAMADASIDFTAQVYDGARHAFFNDTNSITYDAGVAADAFARTLSFLDAALAD